MCTNDSRKYDGICQKFCACNNFCRKQQRRLGFSILIILSSFNHALSFKTTTSIITTPRSYGKVTNNISNQAYIIVSNAAPSNTNNEHEKMKPPFFQQIAASVVASTTLSFLFSANIAFADTLGVETEARTLYTGESVEICVKRGPLGRCEKTIVRTEQNDNDKASRYMKPMDESTREKDLAMRSNNEELPGDTSELLKRLKAKTEENKEKNARTVATKTYLNNQGANFGPFDRSTLILNADGSTFTLLENPQAMRLKKQGYIVGRQFVKQPSQEVVDEALVAGENEGINGILKVFGFGKSSDDLLDNDISALEARQKSASSSSANSDGGLFGGIGNKLFSDKDDTKEVAPAPIVESKENENSSKLLNSIGNKLFGESTDISTEAISPPSATTADVSVQKASLEVEVVAAEKPVVAEVAVEKPAVAEASAAMGEAAPTDVKEVTTSFQ
mmetsp:Transcript_40244/g.47081  ORF Transcript_40244/g.47081 Transcript_40244/m.47081 type:complete len:448 (-) Transcript_40244:295-1638(-)